jgi:hypothetical protein
MLNKSIALPCPETADSLLKAIIRGLLGSDHLITVATHLGGSRRDALYHSLGCGRSGISGSVLNQTFCAFLLG